MLKKRIMTFFLCLICIAALSASAYAETETDKYSAEYYAYMDLDSASEEMQEKILEAREEIIYQYSWVADGYYGYTYDLETGEILEVTPQFSELFPDWDVPCDDTMISSDISVFDVVSPMSKTMTGTFSVYLKNPADTTNSSPFCTVTPIEYGYSLNTYAISLTSSETYNLGYTNVTTGKQIGYRLKLSLGEGYDITLLSYSDKISIRASTYSNPGWASIKVINTASTIL